MYIGHNVSRTKTRDKIATISYAAKWQQKDTLDNEETYEVYTSLHVF